jgi:hypothetical protein
MRVTIGSLCDLWQDAALYQEEPMQRKWLVTVALLGCIAIGTAAVMCLSGAEKGAAQGASSALSPGVLQTLSPVGTSSQRWEYMVVLLGIQHLWDEHTVQYPSTMVKAQGMGFQLESPDTEAALTAAGQAGWELVSVIEPSGHGGAHEYTFKRPLL